MIFFYLNVVMGANKDFQLSKANSYKKNTKNFTFMLAKLFINSVCPRIVKYSQVWQPGSLHVLSTHMKHSHTHTDMCKQFFFIIATKMKGCQQSILLLFCLPFDS